MSEQIFIANVLSWFFHQQIYEKKYPTDENEKKMFTRRRIVKK